MLMVEHNLSVVSTLSDTITVFGTRQGSGRRLRHGVERSARAPKPISEPVMPEATLEKDRPQPGIAAPLLSIRDLNAWYGESHVLHGMNLDVYPGEVVTLLGRNGRQVHHDQVDHGRDGSALGR